MVNSPSQNIVIVPTQLGGSTNSRLSNINSNQQYSPSGSMNGSYYNSTNGTFYDLTNGTFYNLANGGAPTFELPVIGSNPNIVNLSNQSNQSNQLNQSTNSRLGDINLDQKYYLSGSANGTPTLSHESPVIASNPHIVNVTDQANVPAIQQTVSHVDNHPPSGHLDCCICMESTVLPDKTLKCTHAICSDCTRQLRKAECPVCRAKLEGGYYTQDVRQAIQAADMEDKYVEETSDAIYARYSQRFSVMTPQISSDLRSSVDAFKIFISSNPNMSFDDAYRIFSSFVRFYELESAKDKNLNWSDAINKFTTIGLLLLENPGMTFNEAYQSYLVMVH
jgi:hypothetical protein